MVDWTWFGWTLAGSAFCGSTAVWALRTFLHTPDSVAVSWAGVVFVVVLVALFVARIRLNAWCREYALSEDFGRDR